MTDGNAIPAPPVERIRKWLGWVLIVAIVDAVLLIPLIYGLIVGNESISPIVGPIHGFGFVLLMAMTAFGAWERMWGWWFPAITILTFGPPGSIIGDLVIRRQLDKAGK